MRSVKRYGSSTSSGSFRNFRVISGNSVNSGNFVIPLKFPLNFRVIPGFWKLNLFPLDFRVTRNSVNFRVTHCLNIFNHKYAKLDIKRAQVSMTFSSGPSPVDPSLKNPTDRSMKKHLIPPNDVLNPVERLIVSGSTSTTTH